MQGAVSATLELSGTSRRRVNRLGRPEMSGVIEIRPEPAIIVVPPSRDISAPAAFEDIIPRERSEAVSRAANIIIAALVLIVLAPLFVLVALAVKVTSRGPIFYSQVRVGVDRRFRKKTAYDRRGYDHGGKPFMMFKFRTMRVDAESDGRAVWASTNDPRVTPVGNFMRRTRLDELPQLLNVLRGDMNIVGPRPERPTIFADLRRKMPGYPMRQRVKPGLTGWAQINLAYDASIDDVRRKVQFDLDYMKRQSLVHDLRIMSMTLPVMVFRRGSK
ncbi:MAG: sugar transferase [Gemmatimonadetes bacterium]|nr:sugar transferase [Gemmatimonadota bacterium]